MTRSLHTLALSLLALDAASCIRITNVSIGQKTSLERQLVGELEPLTDEELLSASVRASGGLATGSPGEIQTRAIAARQRQLFNRDDILELKSLGCLGEAHGASLVEHSCELESSSDMWTLRARLVEQENVDRRLIVDWVLASDPTLTASDRAELTVLYHTMLLAQARPGDWIETVPGQWHKQP
ncbi:MAG: hypothetical protein AAB426_00195 [Myxococcota bacterium]